MILAWKEWLYNLLRKNKYKIGAWQCVEGYRNENLSQESRVYTSLPHSGSLKSAIVGVLTPQKSEKATKPRSFLVFYFENQLTSTLLFTTHLIGIEETKEKKISR